MYIYVFDLRPARIHNDAHPEMLSTIVAKCGILEQIGFAPHGIQQQIKSQRHYLDPTEHWI